jgi:protein O-mannosyl-transferase
VTRPRPRSRPGAAPAERGGGTPRQPRWPAAAIAAVTLATYVNALDHPFVFDDSNAIVENPTIQTLGASVWGGPAQGATAGRPIVNITFAVNHIVGGVSPWGYHAVNLVIHVGCALLVFALLRRVLALPRLSSLVPGRESGASFAVALLWAVHPLNSELVNYATQRTEGLMALAFLTTLYAGVRAMTVASSNGWYAVSILACALGMGCKESMVAAPVLMLLLDATFISAGPVDAVRRRPLYYAMLFSTWLLLAAFVVEGPRWRSAGFTSGVSPWVYALNQAPMIARYLRLVFVPTGLVLDYGEPAALTLGTVWPSAALVLTLLGVTIAGWFVAPAAAFLGTWFFVTLAPASSFLPIATEVGAERRMYLPLVAVLALIVLSVARLLDRRLDARRRSNVTAAGLAIACVLLAALTVVRNREYHTLLGIWQTVVERRPTGRAHYNLGLELRQAGRRDEALREYQLAQTTHPDAHYAIGFELDADGRQAEAIEHYRTFIRLKPDDVTVPRTYHQIGRALIALGRRDEAAAAFRETLARKPGDADAMGGLADTLLGLERWSEAATVYADFLRLKPSDPDARFNLGIALVRLDRDAEAREAFAAVVQLQPDNVAAHVNLAYALANTGRYSDSVREFRRAAELEKDPATLNDINQAIAELLGNH